MVGGIDKLMAHTAMVLIEQANQHIGVHAVLVRQCSDGGTRRVAGSHQLGLRLRRVSAMGASRLVCLIL